jgi:hypothetical protein
MCGGRTLYHIYLLRPSPCNSQNSTIATGDLCARSLKVLTETTVHFLMPKNGTASLTKSMTKLHTTRESLKLYRSSKLSFWRQSQSSLARVHSRIDGKNRGLLWLELTFSKTLTLQDAVMTHQLRSSSWSLKPQQLYGFNQSRPSRWDPGSYY